MSTSTVNISAGQVKELREKTGAPMGDCKNALVESKGDLEQAIVWLRKKGVATAAKKSTRATSEGAVASYIHAGGKIGVLLEVNCESDFVARTDDFKELVHDIAMHIAATDPRYVGLPGIGLLPDIVVTATYLQQLLVESSHVETSTRTVADDLGAGLLSIVGLAPSESQQVSSTLSVSNSADSVESTSVSTTLTARTLVPGERTELAVFYDRVFGNVAFQDPRP